MSGHKKSHGVSGYLGVQNWKIKYLLFLTQSEKTMKCQMSIKEKVYGGRKAVPGDSK